MRTRIALAVAVPVAIITVSSITQTATAQSVVTPVPRLQGAEVPVVAVHRLKSTGPRATSHPRRDPRDPTIVELSLPFDPGSTPLLHAPVTVVVAAFHDRAAPSTRVKGKAAHATSANGVVVHANSLAAPASTPSTVSPAPAPTTVATTPPSAAPVPAGPVDTVTPDERAAWEQVAMCEEGGDWEYDGGSYSGGLGISRTNWDAYGGLEYAPEGAEATEDEQIMVAERIQFTPPDQDGCSGW